MVTMVNDNDNVNNNDNDHEECFGTESLGLLPLSSTVSMVV